MTPSLDRLPAKAEHPNLAMKRLVIPRRTPTRYFKTSGVSLLLLSLLLLLLLLLLSSSSSLFGITSPLHGDKNALELTTL